MEFHEKLQELRKRRALTQEELAEMLFVSRTAISKWESGRGYPSLDSLRAIAHCFSVSLDDLLSGDALLTIAEEEKKQKKNQLLDLVLGLLDAGVALLLFLPLFGQRETGRVREVSLLFLTAAAPYRKAAFLAVVIATALFGVATLALQGCQSVCWLNGKRKLSLGLSTFGTVLFTVALQPYAAVFVFSLLTIKAVLLIKEK